MTPSATWLRSRNSVPKNYEQNRGAWQSPTLTGNESDLLAAKQTELWLRQYKDRMACNELVMVIYPILWSLSKCVFHSFHYAANLRVRVQPPLLHHCLYITSSVREMSLGSGKDRKWCETSFRFSKNSLKVTLDLHMCRDGRLLQLSRYCEHRIEVFSLKARLCHQHSAWISYCLDSPEFRELTKLKFCSE